MKTCTNLKEKTHVYNIIEKCIVKSRFEFVHDEIANYRTLSSGVRHRIAVIAL